MSRLKATFRSLTFITLLFFSSTLWAVEDSYVFTDPETKQRFYYLLGELRCLVCQNQSLADSNAPLAEDLRREVYEMVQENKNDQQITDYLVARYGDFVLYNPPFKAATYFLWLGPFVLLACGIVVLCLYVKRNRSNSR